MRAYFCVLLQHNLGRRFGITDKQKALKRNYIYIVEIGVLGVYLVNIYYNILTHMHLFKTVWFVFRVTHQHYEIEWSKGHYSEVVGHLK